MPKISVIIPVYKAEAFLPRCLDSILNQTLQDLEIICVNDCSPDRSAEILEMYRKKDPKRILVINNAENIGASFSRRAGICQAGGAYALFMDSDDYVEPEYAERMLEAIEASGCDFVMSGYIREVDGNKTNHTNGTCRFGYLLHPIPNRIFRTEYLKKHDFAFTRQSFGEDILLNLSILCTEPVWKTTDYCGYHYCLNRNSTTGSATRGNHEQLISAIYSQFLSSHAPADLSRDIFQIIEYSYIVNMVNALITYGRGCGISQMRKKYAFVMADLKEKFPDYRSNPYVGFRKPEGETAKIRYAVGLTGLLHTLHADKLMFELISLL